MKLSELEQVIIKARKMAGVLNPQVEFWLGDKPLYVKRIGQFHLEPDLIFTFTTSKRVAEREMAKPKQPCSCGKP